MFGFLIDLRHAIRRAWATPGFTLTAVLCLSLTIGATTAVFSVVHAVLFRPLPFENPDRLVSVWASYDLPGAEGVKYLLSPAEFVEIHRRSTSLVAIAATRETPVSFGMGDTPERIDGAEVSADLFSLLGVRPVLGRTFQPDEDRAGNRVVLISEGLWRRLGSQQDVVGSAVILNEAEHVVLGVLPDEQRYPGDVDVWVPLAVDDVRGQARHRGSLNVVARMEPAVTLTDVRSDISAIADDYKRDNAGTATGLGFGSEQLRENMVGDLRAALFTLFAAVGFLFAIGIVNVANLLLVRGHAESRLVALRIALGATPMHVLRRALTENLLLASFGGALGILLAYAALPPLIALQPRNLVPFGGVTVDGAVLIFGFVVSIATALVIGVAVAIRQLRSDPSTVLKENSVRSGMGRSGRRVLSTLAAVEIATALVLLVGAGLMIKSLVRANAVAPGFNTDGVLVVRVSAPARSTDEHTGRVAFFEQVLEAVRAVPGVTAAGAAHVLPVGDMIYGMGFNVEGQPPATLGERQFAVYRLVTPGYFESMQIPLLAGRGFEASDRDDARPVAIVSRALGDQYWPEEDPVGKQIKRGTYDNPDEPWREVVGVVDDVRDQGPTEDVQPALFLPHAQFSRSYASVMGLTVRTSLDPMSIAPEVRRVISSVDGNASVYGIAPIEELVAETVSQQRFNAVLIAVFAALGVLLAGAGIYGVVSYGVSQRRGELGLRMALGADRGSVLALVLNMGARFAAAGTIGGVLVALVLTRLMAGVLFEVPHTDPLIYVGVALALSSVTLVAAFIPAWRATKVDPLEALIG